MKYCLSSFVDVHIFTLIAHESFGTIWVDIVEKGGRQTFM